MGKLLDDAQVGQYRRTAGVVLVGEADQVAQIDLTVSAELQPGAAPGIPACATI